VEEERRAGTKGYELEQEYSQEETKGRRRCRCREKICSAGVPLFRAQRRSASGHKVSKRVGCGKGVE
jgi:hypothetical protein